MGIVGDGLERAVQQAFTRPIPKSAGAQMRYLVKQLKGTRAVADALGVSARGAGTGTGTGSESDVRDASARDSPVPSGRRWSSPNSPGVNKFFFSAPPA